MPMTADEVKRWMELLRQPELPFDLSSENVYRASCIGAVTLLYEDGNCEALADIVRYGSSPESRARALFAVRSMTRASEPVRSAAIHQLYRLAVLDGNAEAGDYLRKSALQDADPGWNSARLLLFEQKNRLLKEDPDLDHLSRLFLDGPEPLRLRLLSLGTKALPDWTMFMTFFNDPSAQNRELLLEAFAGFSPAERKLLRFCSEMTPEIASVAADILLRYEDETALELCLKHDLKPSDPSMEALFYFLSGQWERYYRSDSDYRRIRIAYDRNDPVLQRRLIAVSRESGNSGWLRSISSSADNAPNDGSLSDQRLLIDALISQRQWSRLWELLPNVPLLCMPVICRALDQAGFKPTGPEEADFLKELSARITACEGLSPIPLRSYYSEAGGTAIGICGGGPFFAVLFSDRRILVRDTRSETADPIVITSNRLNFRRAVISRDGKYLCADCGKDGITIFSLPGVQAVKTFSNDASPLVGLYLQSDGRRLITLAQNGKGTIYAFPGGPELSRFDFGVRDLTRSAYDAQNGQICGITLSGICTVYDIRERRLVTELQLPDSIPAALETCSRGRISFVDREERLSTVNLMSEKPILDRVSLGGGVRRIMEFVDGNLFLLGTLDGRIQVFDPIPGEDIAVLSFGSRSAVTGIWLDSDEKVLYGCTANGIVRSWDLTFLHWMDRILPLLQLPGLNRIDDYSRKYPEPGVKAAAAWLKTVINWRRRFDIEVDFDF